MVRFRRSNARNPRAAVRIGAAIAAGIAGGASPAQEPLAEIVGAPGDFAGYALAAAGDVDGDGFADLLVGAPRAVTGLGTRDGQAWIASGRFLATGAGPARIRAWDGNLNLSLSATRFGHALAGGADLDLDAVPDVVVGARGDDQGGLDGGSVSVFSGGSGALLARFDGPPHFAMGTSVAFAGDVNGDGWVDVLAGGPVFDTTFGVAYGQARVYSGEWIARTAAGQVPASTSELAAFVGLWNHDDFGQAVAPLGDLDGDGRADFAVGAKGGGAAAGGYVAIYRGGTSVPFVVVSGAAQNDFYGAALAACGDVDGDLLPDLCVGAWGVDGPGGGNSVFGSAEILRGAWLLATGLGQTPTVSRTVWTRLGAGYHDFYGTRVSAAGDLDLDGAPEVIVSAPQSGYGPPESVGYAEVLSGRTGALLFRVNGRHVGGQHGVGLAGAGDLDADGRPDLAVGAQADIVGGPDSGVVRVLRGFPRVGAPVCAASATVNSSGGVARLAARGTASVLADGFFLELTGAPAGRAAVFFRGSTTTLVPFGNGVRCAGGSLQRVASGVTGSGGALVRPAELAAGRIGSTLVFQTWFDDAPAGGSGFNTSDAASVTVLP